MKKIFLKFHLWLSVPFGIIVTLICFSGAMLVFEPEAVKLLRHERAVCRQTSAHGAADRKSREER